MTAARVITPSSPQELFSFVKEQSGQDISRCYQCGKCYAGCPLAYAMDLGPQRVIRAAQLGLKEEALNNNTIWICVCCMTCSVRCPLEIDIAKVMGTLRHLAIAEGRASPEKEIKIFHEIFLNRARSQGRIHELSLGFRYNLATKRPFANVFQGLSMISKGKLSLRGEKIKGSSEVRSIFDKAKGKSAGR